MKQFKGTYQSLETRDVSTRLEPGTVHPTIRSFIQQEQSRLATTAPRARDFSRIGEMRPLR
jgi:hypothetical protein